MIWNECDKETVHELLENWKTLNSPKFTEIKVSNRISKFSSCTIQKYRLSNRMAVERRKTKSVCVGGASWILYTLTAETRLFSMKN